jgi:aminobenzoyl-glutamate utilization protein B
MTKKSILIAAWLGVAAAAPADRVASLKADVLGQVDRMKDQVQVMVDTIFSFAELGFQEVETSRYLTDMLRKEGFRVNRGIAEIPTAWLASWGEGRPVIALGTDIDCIPQASQKPGVAWHDPLIQGAPGHGEGHNSGQAVNIVAALAVKRAMEREHLQGTIRIWPGVAEEQLGTKAYYVRAGLFKDVDVVLFAHVDNNFKATWGDSGSGLISVEYRFEGESAHAAGAPWRGRSALDAVELMDAGWNFRREHLRLQQRSHYVITNGGDQPNVVPGNASVWYFFREMTSPRIKELWEIGDKMAQGAALMTNTSFTSRVLGSAWPAHFNRPLAEDMYENMKAVGLPAWSEDDQRLAKALQKELHEKEEGLATKIPEIKGADEDSRMGGGSDDIGDVSWNVPTVNLRYPANIPNLPGHNWSNAVAMATPLAHKGSLAGAKVQALTMLDILISPELVAKAWNYFRDVQTKETHYTPLIRSEDQPAIWLNRKVMDQYRLEMRRYYYNSEKYKTYLEQLGISYPTVR